MDKPLLLVWGTKADFEAELGKPILTELDSSQFLCEHPDCCLFEISLSMVSFPAWIATVT